MKRETLSSILFLSQLWQPFEAKILHARDSVAQSSYFMINMRGLDSHDPIHQSPNKNMMLVDESKLDMSTFHAFNIEDNLTCIAIIAIALI